MTETPNIAPDRIHIDRVQVEGITKMFGAMRALIGVSFELNSGDVIAIMGRNGAGKSTLLQILSLSMRPSRGRVLFNRSDAREMMPRVFAKIGLLSHKPLVYPDMTCRENLSLFAKLYNIPGRDDAVEAMMASLGMEDFATDRPTRVLSRGQLQRIALARALISKPDLLLLDEPAAGLDQEAVYRIDNAINELTNRGGMAVVVTHEIEVAARVATRALMIRDGQVASDEPAPSTGDEWRALYERKVGAA